MFAVHQMEVGNRGSFIQVYKSLIDDHHAAPPQTADASLPHAPFIPLFPIFIVMKVHDCIGKNNVAKSLEILEII